jgi:hypothetical protein
VEGRLIENSYNEFLTENRRKRGDTEVVFLSADGKIDTAVLRSTALGDVKSRHDLQTCADSRIRFDREFRSSLQVAVDTVSYLNRLLKGLDMYITRSVRNCFLDDRVNEAYGGVIDNVVLI